MNRTHRDCLFRGGPHDGSIRETLNTMTTVIIGKGDDAPRYVRTCADRFTFVSESARAEAEAKQETWHDRKSML